MFGFLYLLLYGKVKMENAFGHKKCSMLTHSAHDDKNKNLRKIKTI